MSGQTPYPPPEAKRRAVLVRNISHLATPAAIEEFFSFCGPVSDHRMRTVEPARPGADPTLEAVVIFADERVCADALVMDGSSIVDQPVTISSVPDGYDFSKPPPIAPAAQPQSDGFFSGGFAAFGDLFSGVGTAVAAEMDKASKALDSATDTGVLKAAKEQVALASQKTREFAVDLDDKWHVRNNILNTVETGKAKASEVASVVAEQTTKVATDIDNKLHLSENTGKLAVKARENDVVNNGFLALSGGLQTLMAQTGLGAGAAPAVRGNQEASAAADSTSAPLTTTAKEPASSNAQ